MFTEKKYLLPDFLKNVCSEEVYWRWLGRESSRFLKNDLQYRIKTISRLEYKDAIHNAVLKYKDVDAYTGQILNWKLLGKFDSKMAREHGLSYKTLYSDIPTASLLKGGAGHTKIVICAWVVEECKGDLSFKEFSQICVAVTKNNKRINNKRDGKKKGK